MTEDERLTSPAVARNREPILGALRRVLPRSGLVLEVASGTGEHAAWFSHALPSLVWQPTDAEPGNLRSIAAWAATSPASRLLPPLLLDAAKPDTWPVRHAHAVVAINLIHIAPWQAAEGLFAGASAILAPGGALVLYGPFLEGGQHTAPSNATFDAELRSRNAEWGVRDLSAVTALGERHGLSPDICLAMPANNLTVAFRQPVRPDGQIG